MIGHVCQINNKQLGRFCANFCRIQDYRSDAKRKSQSTYATGRYRHSIYEIYTQSQTRASAHLTTLCIAFNCCIDRSILDFTSINTDKLSDQIIDERKKMHSLVL